MAEKLPQSFEEIILTLDNCLLPNSKLEETPSQRDGLNREIEIDLRIVGCELIQTAGILLKLRQVTMATGQVLFQRFYYAKSFINYSMEVTAMSCIYLASKIEESPRQILDVINVFNHIKQVRGQQIIAPMILDQAYVALKTKVIDAERRVLKELGFCVHIKNSPHKLLLMYLKVLGLEAQQKLVQFAWNYMNDLLRTDVFVRYRPETIACACIYLTGRKLNLPLPNNPAWYEVFKVTEEDIIDISYRISELYRRPKPNVEKLEQAVEQLKSTYLKSRCKGRTDESLPQQPPLTTIVSRTDGSYNYFTGFISRVPENSEEKPSTVSISESTNDERRTHKYRGRSPTKNNDERRTHKYRARSPTPTRYAKTKSRNSRSPTSSSSSSGSQHKKRHRDSRSVNYYYKSRPRYSTDSRSHEQDKSDNYSNRHSCKDQNHHREDGTKYRPRSRDRSRHRSSSIDGYSSSCHKKAKRSYHSRYRKS